MEIIDSRIADSRLAVSLASPGTHNTTDMSSMNYRVRRDTTEGDGDSAPVNYNVRDSIGLSTVIDESASTNYRLVAGFESVPDENFGCILNAMDNCTQFVNADQRNIDDDGFGNICEPDFDNNEHEKRHPLIENLYD